MVGMPLKPNTRTQQNVAHGCRGCMYRQAVPIGGCQPLGDEDEIDSCERCAVRRIHTVARSLLASDRDFELWL